MLMTDDKIATLLLISAQDCAQLSQMVAEKTKNEKVRSFAEQRAQASQKMVQQLQPFAGQRSNLAGNQGENRLDSAPARDLAERQRSSAQNQDPERREIEAEQPAVQRQGQTQGEFDIVQAKRSIAQEAMQLIKKEMQEKSGAELDMAYIGSEIVGLTNALACLEVSKRHAGSELGETLDTAIQQTRQARDQAEELAKSLGQSDQAGSEKRTDSQTPRGAQNPADSQNPSGSRNP
jgi:hypothetical protein